MFAAARTCLLLLCFGVASSQECTCKPTPVVQKLWGDSDVIFWGNLRPGGKGNIQATVTLPLKGCLRASQKIALSTGPPCAFRLPVGSASQTYLVTGTRDAAGKVTIDRCGWTKPKSKVDTADILWLVNQIEKCPNQPVQCANNRTALLCDTSSCNLAECPGAAACEGNACHNCALQYLTADRKLKCGELGGQAFESKLCPACSKNLCAGKKPESLKDDCDDWQKAVTCISDSCFGCEEPIWVDAFGRQVCLDESASHKCTDLGNIVFSACSKPSILGYANVKGQTCVPVQGCLPLPPGVHLYKSEEKCIKNCVCADFTDVNVSFNASDNECNQQLGWARVNQKCTVIKGCVALKTASAIMNSLYSTEAICKSTCGDKLREYEVSGDKDNKRPADWVEEANGPDVAPSYSRVFPRNKVNRVDISIEPAEWAAMQEDVENLMKEYADVAAKQGGGVGRRLLQRGGGKGGGGNTQSSAIRDVLLQNLLRSRMGGSDPLFGALLGAREGPDLQRAAMQQVAAQQAQQAQQAMQQAALQQAALQQQAAQQVAMQQPSVQQAGAQRGVGWEITDPAARRQVEKMFAGDALPDGSCRPLCGSGGYCPPRRDQSAASFGFNERGVLLSREPNYFRVTVRSQGYTWHNVGIRYKGGSSMIGAYFIQSQMMGFRLKLDEFSDKFKETKDQTFFGFQKLTFSNNWMDKSHIREILSYEIVGASGAKAARATPVRVYFDIGDGKGPVFWGLYTMIEDPTDVLVRTYTNDTRPGKGNIYKPENNTWERFVQQDFEKKNNDKNGSWTDVKNAIAALHAPTRLTSPPAWRAGLEAVFDTVSFLRTLAVSSVIGNWDSYGLMPHNYYLYNYNGKLTWIPWDFNLALNCDDRTTSVMKNELGNEWPLISFLLGDAEYRRTYTSLVEWLVTSGPFVIKDLTTRKNQLIALVTPHITGQRAPNGTWILEPETAPHTTMFDPSSFATESAKLDVYFAQRDAITRQELQMEAARLQQQGRLP